MSNSESPRCRLCSNPIEFAFSKKILSAHDIKYFRCGACNSLQTSKPYWLEIAYSDEIPNFDTGAVQRTLWNFTAVVVSAKILGLTKVLDFGGGHALLSRLIRDYGLEAFSEDAYVPATFIGGIQRPQGWKPEIVSAFEVLEHFDNPSEQINDLFKYSPECIIVSTQIYSGQGPEWWYLSVENGQHVFFYSTKAMKDIAATFGYTLSIFGNYHLLHKRSLGWKRVLLKLALNKYVLHVQRSILLLVPPNGPEKDLRRLKSDSSYESRGGPGIV